MRLATLILISLLAGCAAQAAGPDASVDVNALVKTHPLYGTLTQYDRQIDELRGTLHAAEFSRKNDAIANAQRAVDSTLTQTASRAKQIAALPSPDVQSLQANENIAAPSEQRVRRDLQNNYSTQFEQLQSSAQEDMTRYRSALLAQQNTAFANYQRAVQARVQQAYFSRRQELYEKESTLLLDLARADASKRLTLRAKLQTLALNSGARHAIKVQLNAIQAREDAVVAKQRRADKAVLAALLPSLQAKANADIARTRADLQNRTAANLTAREHVLAAQNASDAPLNLGKPLRTATPTTDMRGQLNALLAAQPADPNAFTTTRDDLSRQLGAVQNADQAATHSTWAELSTLSTERAQLYSTIVSQIMRDADNVAEARGLGKVYAAKQAPAGSTDITGAVRADFLAMAR